MQKSRSLDFHARYSPSADGLDSGSNPSTLNTIRDMIAGLPQFQEGKELYSLHLNMAQDCMNIFQKCRLPDVASVEQVSRLDCSR